MQPKKHYFAHIPTIVIFIVFAMSTPLGVLLFILKSIDKNAEKEEKAAAQAQADYRSDLGPASAQTAPRQENEPAYGHDVPTKEQKDAQNWHKTIAVICTILGAIFLFTGAEELIDCLFDFPDFDDLLPALATTIGGAGALWTGLRMDRTRKLERRLDKIVGGRDNIPLDELFAAAKRMKQEYGDGVEFHIVGSFEEGYKPLMDELEKAGVVKYHGYQSDMKRFYAMASCVVLPSYHEGMSNVLLEAAASGRPLITSDIPGCREAVEDGVSGYLCPAKDADALYEAMRRFVELPESWRGEMGRRGRERMEQQFSKTAVVAETIDKLTLL